MASNDFRERNMNLSLVPKEFVHVRGARRRQVCCVWRQKHELTHCVDARRSSQLFLPIFIQVGLADGMFLWALDCALHIVDVESLPGLSRNNEVDALVLLV